MTSSGKAVSTNSRMAMLITKLNRPRVIMRKGQVIFLIMGRMILLINPNTNPAKNKTCIDPLK